MIDKIELSGCTSNEKYIRDKINEIIDAYNTHHTDHLNVELSTPRLMEECPECKGTGHWDLNQEYLCPRCTGKKPSNEGLTHYNPQEEKRAVTEEGLEKVIKEWYNDVANRTIHNGEVMSMDLNKLTLEIMKYMEGR